MGVYFCVASVCMIHDQDVEERVQEDVKLLGRKRVELLIVQLIHVGIVCWCAMLSVRLRGAF
jgi:hypothetical protein